MTNLFGKPLKVTIPAPDKGIGHASARRPDQELLREGRGQSMLVAANNGPGRTSWLFERPTRLFSVTPRTPMTSMEKPFSKTAILARAPMRRFASSSSLRRSSCPIRTTSSPPSILMALPRRSVKCFSSLSKIRLRFAASCWSVGSSSRNGMLVPDSESERN